MGRVFQDVTAAGPTEGELDFDLEDASPEEQRATLAERFGGGAGGAAAADAYLASKAASDGEEGEVVTGPDLSSKDVGCQGFSDTTPDSAKISKHFTIASLSTKPLAQKNAVPLSKIAVVGGRSVTLTRAQIICNLKYLAVNTLDPLVEWLKSKGYGYQIGSAYRGSSGGAAASYHKIGSAADVYITKAGTRVDRETLRLISKAFIEEGVAHFTQVLVEWNGSGKPGWLHVANSRMGSNGGVSIGHSYDGLNIRPNFPTHS